MATVKFQESASLPGKIILINLSNKIKQNICMEVCFD